MPDLTITTAQAVQYAHARAVTKAANRLLPFPVGHLLRKLDAKIQAPLTAYEASRVELAQAHCTKGDDGPVMENGNYQFTPEGLAAFQAGLAPILAEPITLHDVVKVKAAAFGETALSEVEMDGLSPFIDD